MKKGFSLITAIIFVVLIATLGALAITLATSGLKQTKDLYLKEQAELLMQSASEFAIMAIQGHDFNTNCLERVNFKYPHTTPYLFEGRVDIRYIGDNLICTNNHQISGSNTNSTGINNYTMDRNGTTQKTISAVMFDIFINSNPDLATEPVNLHKRIIQKP